MDKSKIVDISIDIKAPSSRVWHIITDKTIAKELGVIFDKGAYVESDWQLGSDVHFKYEPGRIASTGKVGKLIVNELIQIDYDFPGMDYLERYSIHTIDEQQCTLAIFAGEYTQDYEAQKVVWSNWLAKVKEMSEA